MFKANNEDTRTTSFDVVWVSSFLTLNILSTLSTLVTLILLIFLVPHFQNLTTGQFRISLYFVITILKVKHIIKKFSTRDETSTRVEFQLFYTVKVPLFSHINPNLGREDFYPRAGFPLITQKQ